MKKLLAIIAAIAVVIPSTSVLALSGEAVGGQPCSVTSSCFEYKLGDLKNFITGPNELAELKAGNLDVGQYGIIIEDLGAGSQYVKALTLSPYYIQDPYFDPTLEDNPMDIILKELPGYIMQTASDSWEYAEREKVDENEVLKVSFISLDELKAAFGAKMESETKYIIDIDKVPKRFKEALETQIKTLVDNGLTSVKNGFYTSTYDKEAGYVWVVKYQMSGDTITGMTVEQDDINTNNYGVLPAVYFNKDYDCKQNTQAKENYACYSCGETYTWLEVGKQDPTCTLVGNVTQKVKCVKNAKTGVKEYIVEFVGITAICGIALVLAKKKDIFKSI